MIVKGRLPKPAGFSSLISSAMADVLIRAAKVPEMAYFSNVLVIWSPPLFRGGRGPSPLPLLRGIHDIVQRHAVRCICIGGVIPVQVMPRVSLCFGLPSAGDRRECDP